MPENLTMAAALDSPTATVLAALIAAAASFVAAYLSNRARSASDAVERRMKIRQARLDERDLIHAAGGFLIPVETDALWRDYFSDVQNGRLTRKDASLKVQQKAPSAVDPIVAEKLSD